MKDTVMNNEHPQARKHSKIRSSLKTFAFVLAAISLSACGISVDGEKYLDAGPDLSLFGFFEGDVRGWGIVQDRDGNLLQRFEVDIVGSVSGNQLTLDETFRYSFGDGPKTRVWTITQQAPGIYDGAAGDIEGPAKGQTYGNAFYWTYKMDIPVDSGTYRVKFQDWMWAFDGQTVMNRSYIKKFGITWAEVTLFMQKQ